jgi:23S rRNA (uracil1939-C5)-methyltransferase
MVNLVLSAIYLEDQLLALQGDLTLVLNLNISNNNLTLNFAGGGFSQTNLGINQLLVQRVVDLISEQFPTSPSQTRAETVNLWDLYSGAGNFAIPLAYRGYHVSAVESCQELATACRRTAHAKNLDNLTEYPVSVEKFLKNYSQKLPKSDIIIADPPRSGLGAVAKLLMSQNPQQLILISCFLPAAVRDLTELVATGWKIAKIIPFDMFPHTEYLELLTVLQKK